MRSRSIVTAVAIVSTMVSAACSKPAPEQAAQQQAVADTKKGAQTAQQGANQMAQGLQQMAQGLQQMAGNANRGQPAQPLDFQKLETALPAPGGWTKSEPEGRQMAMPFPMSTTSAKYRKGDMEVTVTITDSAFSQIAIAPLTMMTAAGYSEKTSSGYTKATMLGGVPAYEEWKSESKHGNIGLLSGKRFVVEVTGSHLDSIDTIKDIAQKVDLNKLSALK